VSKAGQRADKISAVRSKKAVQKPRMPGKRAGSQGTAVKGGKMPERPNRPAEMKVETPSMGAGKPAGKPSEYCVRRYGFWISGC
jgi:hypothetical protein